MKNRGRRHKAGGNSTLAGISNCKGYFPWITRPINQMDSRTGKDITWKVSTAAKKHWGKRMRGYLKSQTKNLYETDKQD